MRENTHNHLHWPAFSYSWSGCHGAGEAGVPDGEAGKTLEVARGSVDAKGRRVWAVKDKAAEGSHAPAEQQGTAGAAPSSSA